MVIHTKLQEELLKLLNLHNSFNNYDVNANKINIEYRNNRKKPLIFPITFFFGKRAISNTSKAKTNIHIISLLKISVSSTTIGLIIEVIPNTEPILKIFDPIKFPKEIHFSFFTIARRDVANSGILVPTATIETEITASLTPTCSAKLIAP